MNVSPSKFLSRLPRWCGAVILIHAFASVPLANATPNTPPSISPLQDQVAFQNRTTRIPLNITDAESPPFLILVSATSSNPSLIPDTAIQILPGLGSERTLTLTPAAEQLGTSLITVTALDPQGASNIIRFSVLVLADIPVSIPDPNLEAALRDAIFKPSGILTLGDFADLSFLEASGRGIRDLTGIELAPKLAHLGLAFNPIEDYTPVSHLPNLRRLFLDFNGINDLSVLSQLRTLEELSLSNNQITDLSPLANLQRLTLLFLNANPITDYRPLQSLTALKTLSLDNNSLEAFPPLTSLTQLRTLSLNQNFIGNLQELTNFTHLESLSVSYNPIYDYSFLGKLPSLTTLFVQGSFVIDISILGSLPNLKTLGLNDNLVSDLTPLIWLTNLTTLHLNENPIANHTPLSRLQQLELLFLEDSQVTSLSFLAGLSNLHTLNLDRNNISNLAPLSQLNGLTTLTLAANDVTDISPLIALENLLFLDLKYNCLDLTPASPTSALLPTFSSRNTFVNLLPQRPKIDRFSIHLLPDKSLQFTFTATPGQPYRIQHSTNLTTWDQLTNFVSLSQSATIRVAPSAPAHLHYYRIITP